MTAPLSQYARRRKLQYFFSHIDRSARILEIGCADGWVGRYAIANGWTDFVGIDIVPPPTPPGHEFVLGDINQWKSLGLEAESFDAVIAFEVVEHGDFFDAVHALLRPGGKLLVTTPVPHMDWLCKLMERAGLNQRRTSPHSHLTYLRDFPKSFRPVETSVKAGISQWGVFERTRVLVSGR
ncbi:class I SAM-dependent methyltransferase [Planomonospora corallina]|uniref:Class I SAM-dependent methyltransferase n=1 Tax=Planomonospora corallina TaxID=1806052 RepID=A0ABV8I0X6_9ACTN